MRRIWPSFLILSSLIMSLTSLIRCPPKGCGRLSGMSLPSSDGHSLPAPAATVKASIYLNCINDARQFRANCPLFACNLRDRHPSVLATARVGRGKRGFARSVYGACRLDAAGPAAVMIEGHPAPPGGLPLCARAKRMGGPKAKPAHRAGGLCAGAVFLLY